MEFKVMSLDEITKKLTIYKKREKKCIILLYVESRKTIQMNLFAKQKQRHRLENKCMDTKRGGGVGWTGRLRLTYIHYYV